MVDRLLDNVFVLGEIVGHQLTLVVLEVIQDVRDGVVDRIGHTVVDIHKVSFIYRGKNVMHESLIHSCNLLEHMHSLGV